MNLTTLSVPRASCGQTTVLGAGELYFGQAPALVHTLLGSCVAITLWHPRQRRGGMCHYLLPRREDYARNDHGRGHYGSDAIEFFLEQAQRSGCKPSDYEVKVFGGGQMFEALAAKTNPIDVADSNVETGMTLLRDNGFRVRSVDTGGARYRKIFLNLESGDVWVRYGKYAQAGLSRSLEPL